eukprot:TRINITY_DN38855_c0_g1_i2.p1 TRINITY_DN38855_c0_g1~~TRINITY_DN38855_c0_g1_i2.p1  ORF type:complete len:351 (-),score=70.71 TRINITY_DN38855_c0_g1_i2:100-1152(-)
MVSIAAMMSVDIRTLYLNPLGKEDEAKQERQKFNVHESDHLTLLNIYMQFIRAGKSRSWSEDNFLDFKTLMRAVDIRVQFVERMRVAKLPLRSSPSSSANNHYRRGGRHDAEDEDGDHNGKSLRESVDWVSGGTIAAISEPIRQCLAFGYVTQVAKRTKWTEYESLASAVNCFIVPTSAVLDSPAMPEYVVYHEFLLTSKEYMRIVTVVEPEWIVEAASGVVDGLCVDGSVLRYADMMAAIKESQPEAPTKSSTPMSKVGATTTSNANSNALLSALQSSQASTQRATSSSISSTATSMAGTTTSMVAPSSSLGPSSRPSVSTAPSSALRPSQKYITKPPVAGAKRRREGL